MTRCHGQTKAGTRCRCAPLTGRRYCRHHHPDAVPVELFGGPHDGRRIPPLLLGPVLLSTASTPAMNDWPFLVPPGCAPLGWYIHGVYQLTTVGRRCYRFRDHRGIPPDEWDQLTSSGTQHGEATP